MAEVIWSEPALSDLDAIADYNALDNPEAARRLVQRVFQHVGQLKDHPRSGSKHPELEGRRYRQIVEPPCRLFYRENAGRVFILYVMRAERLLRPELLAERDEKKGGPPETKRTERGMMKKSESKQETSPSQMIDARIKELDDWRGRMLSRLRTLIRQADPDVVEEWKWRVPVWSHDGLICTGETYKKVVKMTFAQGAALKDSSGLFNSSLEGNTRRAIDFHEGDQIDEEALKALIRAAVTLNVSRAQG